MKVSVAICTYNGEKYIKEQLVSILNQTHKVDEIIICDDTSKDHTLSLCEEILSSSDIVYKIIKNDEPLHVVKNFHKCYSLCSGDVIFSCDQDDVWETSKVEKIISIFSDRSDIELVASNAILVDSNSKEMGMTLRNTVGFDTPTHHEEWIHNLLRWFCITGATMAIRKSFCDQFFYESSVWLHDGWLSMIAALRNSLYYIDEPLIKYRIHDNNACGIGEFKVLSTGLKKPFYFHKLAKERLFLYEEILNISNKEQWDIVQENEIYLQDCIDFWKIRSLLRDISFFDCLNITRSLKRTNKYRLYTRTNQYFWLDRYFWIMYKLFPNKVKDKGY